LVNDALAETKGSKDVENEEKVKMKNKLALGVIQSFYRSSSFSKSYHLR